VQDRTSLVHSCLIHHTKNHSQKRWKKKYIFKLYNTGSISLLDLSSHQEWSYRKLYVNTAAVPHTHTHTGCSHRASALCPSTSHKAISDPLHNNETQLGETRQFLGDQVAQRYSPRLKHSLKQRLFFVSGLWNTKLAGKIHTQTVERTMCNLATPNTNTEPYTCDNTTRSHRACRSDHCWRVPLGDPVEWPQTQGTWRCG